MGANINSYVTGTDDNADSIEERRKEVKDAGLPVRDHTNEETDFLEELRKQVLKDLIGDGSREAIIKGCRSFSLVKTKNAHDLGLVYKKHHDEITNQNPDQDSAIIDRNAMYMAFSDSQMPNAVYRGISELGRDMINLTMLMSTDEELNDYLSDKMISKLGLDKDMTISAFMEKLGFRDYEKKQYLLDQNCKASDKVYHVFRQKLAQSGNKAENEITENELIEAIQNEYTQQLSASIHLEDSGSQEERLKQYYSSNMTVDYFLSLLSMDDSAKQVYYHEHQCSSDTKLHVLLRSELTVADLLRLRGIDQKDEIQAFLSEHHCQPDSKIPEDVEMTDKDFVNAGCAKLNSVLNTDVKMNQNIQYTTILEFTKQFSVYADKDVYYKGRRIAGYADLPDMPICRSCRRRIP